MASSEGSKINHDISNYADYVQKQKKMPVFFASKTHENYSVWWKCYAYLLKASLDFRIIT